MTKLMEWVTIFVILFSIWFSLITNTIGNSFTRKYPLLVFYSPILVVFIFGLYAASVIFYRVFTFNNCEEAAAELLQEIQEARVDLTKLGFQFKKVK